MLCISRDNPDWLKSKLYPTTEILLLSTTKNKSYKNVGIIDTLINEIKEFTKKNKKSIILMNRLEYLITRFSFSELMRFLYKVNDIIRFTENVFIIHIDYTITKDQLGLISREFEKFPITQKSDIYLNEKKTEVLKFISKLNLKHTAVNYNILNSHFKLAKMTVRNWIDELQEKELIKTQKDGKYKYFFITKKGNSFLSSMSD